MSEAVYERYKEALRRGHVAALRGRLEEALEAYREAASIATERPLPHTSMGGVQLRLGRVDDAVASFGAALERAPRDEAALGGRAEALARAGRVVEAAEALDLAAEVQEAAGRPLDALESARRSLELAESRPRRSHVRRLVAAVAAGAPGEDADRAIERATALLGAADRGPEAEGAPEADDAAAPGATDAGAGPTSVAELEPAGEPADPIALTLAADAALLSGDPAAARDALLAAAAADAAAGLQDSALDACYRALAVAPDDADLHLALVDLYVARGWRSLAARKLSLLERLAALDGDDAALERVRAKAAEAFLDEWREPEPEAAPAD